VTTIERDYIMKTVKELKLEVGDKTNYGVVVSVESEYIEVKAKYTPKTKLTPSSRKIGKNVRIFDTIVKV